MPFAWTRPLFPTWRVVTCGPQLPSERTGEAPRDSGTDALAGVEDDGRFRDAMVSSELMQGFGAAREGLRRDNCAIAGRSRLGRRQVRRRRRG